MKYTNSIEGYEMGYDKVDKGYEVGCNKVDESLRSRLR